MLKKIACPLLTVILFLLSFLAVFSANWYALVYGQLGFSPILFTLLSPMEGTASNIVFDWLLNGLLPSVICAGVLSLFYFSKLKIPMLLKKCVCILLCIALWCSAAFIAEVPKYLIGKITKSDLYETEYVSPDNELIIFPKEKQNLIYIFLESMETTYFSNSENGALAQNAIPELYNLALENTNFSHNNGVGGWSKFTNTTWTSAAITAQTSGVPLSLPITHNIPNPDSNFLPGITTLNDVLHQNGYYQTVMFGSISSYGGKQNYFLQHGADKVLDYKTAVKDNFIPEDYFTWWGFEDKKLFEYAKQELTELSKSEKPFAFTMLTADTHHIEGYKCEDCENTFDNQYQNVLRCSSKQVLEFVNWIKQQDFYKNTTIVIVGDHLSMNAKFFRTNADKDYTRRVYNCFINAKATTENSKNRVFTPMDIFPTTLAALGCEIKGDRLGLGTNLFSATPTLAEKMSLEKLDNEINKASDYYYDTFIKTK